MNDWRDIDPHALEVFYLVLVGLATVAILSISVVIVVALFRGQR
ncbi:hypothetical protein [Microbacterium sp. NPDC058345]